ncbi:MAG: hypothetical protein WAS73_09590 [Defluviicoccus sp.]
MQQQLLADGRRTGLGGAATGADPNVFRRSWGIDPSAPIAFIRFPAADTLYDALTLYQET